uniref:Uncharacterized protein n=1 Tax=Panagrellus redivivus TaxID=6233 RepID=A0A7E4VE89_PANRE
MGLLLSLPMIVIIQSTLAFCFLVMCKQGFGKKGSEKIPSHPSKKELKSEKVPSEKLKVTAVNKKAGGDRTVDETGNITEDPDLVSRDDYGITEQTTMGTKGDSNNSRSAKNTRQASSSAAPGAKSTPPKKKT